MAGNGKDDPPSGRPHVWSFAAVTLAAAIGAAASIVVAVQKGRYDDDRHDLEARIRTLEADHGNDQSRIETLTSQLAAARGERGKPGSEARSPVSAAPRVQRIEDYVFTLDACKRHGADIDCWILVRNDDADRDFQVSSESRLVAEDGSTYQQSAGIIGDQETFYALPVTKLPTGVAIRFGLRFKGLAVKVRHLSLVEVVTPHFRVQFRDVDVS